jgi:hypothetical protein
MELRSHSSVSCHLVAIHGTPTQDEGNVTEIYYRFQKYEFFPFVTLSMFIPAFRSKMFI